MPMSPSHLEPELNNLWKEKEEIEHPKEDTDDNFIPAKEVKMDADNALIHITL